MKRAFIVVCAALALSVSLNIIQLVSKGDTDPIPRPPANLTASSGLTLPEGSGEANARNSAYDGVESGLSEIATEIQQAKNEEKEAREEAAELREGPQTEETQKQIEELESQAATARDKAELAQTDLANYSEKISQMMSAIPK